MLTLVIVICDREIQIFNKISVSSEIVIYISPQGFIQLCLGATNEISSVTLKIFMLYY